MKINENQAVNKSFKTKTFRPGDRPTRPHPWGDDILSSVGSGRSTWLKELLGELQRIQFTEDTPGFTFKGKADLEGLQITVPRLQNIHTQDTYAWSQKLIEGFRMAETEEAKRQTIIRALLSDELRETLPVGTHTSCILIDHILRLQYHKGTLKEIQSKLEKNQLRPGERALDYYKRTPTLFGRADLCTQKLKNY